MGLLLEGGAADGARAGLVVAEDSRPTWPTTADPAETLEQLVLVEKDLRSCQTLRVSEELALALWTQLVPAATGFQSANARAQPLRFCQFFPIQLWI